MIPLFCLDYKSYLREGFIMSEFYARFKEWKYEIITFPTQKERDEWVSYQDEFSRDMKTTPETATFKHIPLTDQQAKNAIKRFGLTETKEEDLMGKIMTIYRRVREEERKVMKKNNGINLQPTMEIAQRKMIASATEKNAIRIGTKKLVWVPVELMNIPPYQRERQKHVNSIAENWDDDKCDVLTVSYDA